MQDADILFFTSVAEGTPHVVLEAIANHLPIVCFNVCGQGDTVTDDIGRKVEMTTPKEAIEDFSRELMYLALNRKDLADMSIQCKEYQQKITWDSKAKQMVELYRSLIEG